MVGARGNKRGLNKVKAHRDEKTVQSLDAAEKMSWKGNKVADTFCKEAAKWHETVDAVCEGMVSATKWRVDAIVNIGNFLSEIALVHELYKDSMESEGEDSEHDVFGHANLGIDDAEAAGTPAGCWADNPDAVGSQGRYELGEHAAATPKLMPPESLGHQWQRSGRSWHCA